MKGVQAVAVEILQLLAQFKIDTEPDITFGPSHFHVKERKVRAPHDLCFWVACFVVICLFSPDTDRKD
jgi:hypothetical protein